MDRQIDMAVWDDEIPAGMIARDPQAVIQAQDVEIWDLRQALYVEHNRRIAETIIAFGVGVILSAIATYCLL